MLPCGSPETDPHPSARLRGVAFPVRVPGSRTALLRVRVADSTYAPCKLKYRHVHKNDDSTNHAADDRHQQRFYQFGGPLRPAGYFFIMKTSDAFHHFAHMSRSFPDAQHPASHCGRKAFGLHGDGDWLALADKRGSSLNPWT